MSIEEVMAISLSLSMYSFDVLILIHSSMSIVHGPLSIYIVTTNELNTYKAPGILMHEDRRIVDHIPEKIIDEFHDYH